MGFLVRCLHRLMGHMDNLVRENGSGLGEQQTMSGAEGAGVWAGTGVLGSRGEAWWWDTDPVPSVESDEG